MFPVANTKDPAAVFHFVRSCFFEFYPTASLELLEAVFRDVEQLFQGLHPDFAEIDLRYHDFEHTLQATVCLVQILAGRGRAKVHPALDARHFELAVAAVLLHDSGYLKLRSDLQGTGAKYTFCHVLRSCAFAASYLPTLGANDYEVEAVIGAINCTGPVNQISRLNFRQPIERLIGSVLGTADYLGQMAAADYPDELEILYDEFAQSDDFLHIPRSRRMFQSAGDLIARTPQFWSDFVRPRLETDFQSVYRFLAEPFPHGSNPYIEAVEANLQEIARRDRASRPAPAVAWRNGRNHVAAQSLRS